MEIELIIASAVAGALTVLSPCVAPILPVILGKSSTGGRHQASRIILSLSFSVIAFTVLLRSSLDVLNLSFNTLEKIAAFLLVAVGLSLFFPMLYEKLSAKIYTKSQQGLAGAQKFEKHSDILTGLALGPVFTSCSPTFAVIVSIMITQSLFFGTIYLGIYTLFLAIMLYTFALYGQIAIRKMGFALDPKGWFRRGVGALLIAIAVLIFFGLDAKFEAWLLDIGVYDPISEFEIKLLDLK